MQQLRKNQQHNLERFQRPFRQQCNNAPQTLEIVVKANRSIGSSGLKCKIPIMIGDQFVRDDATLGVQIRKAYAVKKLFFLPQTVIHN